MTLALNAACHSFCYLHSSRSAETIKLQIQRERAEFSFYFLMRTVRGVPAISTLIRTHQRLATFLRWLCERYVCHLSCDGLKLKQAVSGEAGGPKPVTTKACYHHFWLLKGTEITDQITFHMKDGGTPLTVPMNIITRE